MNRIFFVFLSIAAFLFVTGCTLAPEYTRPSSPVPSDWPSIGETVKYDVSAPTASELPWQEFFMDESLCKIIEIALENNRDLRLSVLNVERARALYGIERAELLPAANIAGSGAKERVPADLSSTGKSAINEEYNLSAGISSWEIDFFGRIRSLGDQALQEYLATEQARRGAQVSLLSAVADAYLTLAADRGNLKLAAMTLESRKSVYDMIRSRYEVGLATELDLYQARSQVDASSVDVARYTQITAKDRNALDLLAGLPVPEGLLPKNLKSIVPPVDISSGLSSEVLLNRPDIIAAEHRLKGAYAYIGAARAAFFPRIFLTTTAGTASAELSGLFSSGSAVWSFVPKITMPIFDARTWAALRVSKAEQKIVLTQYEKAIQTAFREAADVLAVRETIDSQLEAQRSLVDASTRTLELSDARYKNGIDSYLSVLDAQRSLYAVQQGLISLNLAKLSNKVKLYAVLGGGQ